MAGPRPARGRSAVGQRRSALLWVRLACLKVVAPVEVAFLFATALLFAGFLLRVLVPLVQWLYLPASIVGGLVGLAVIQTAEHAGSSTAADVSRRMKDLARLANRRRLRRTAAGTHGQAIRPGPGIGDP